MDASTPLPHHAFFCVFGPLSHCFGGWILQQRFLLKLSHLLENVSQFRSLPVFWWFCFVLRLVFTPFCVSFRFATSDAICAVLTFSGILRLRLFWPHLSVRFVDFGMFPPRSPTPYHWTIHFRFYVSQLSLAIKRFFHAAWFYAWFPAAFLFALALIQRIRSFLLCLPQCCPLSRCLFTVFDRQGVCP